MHAAFSEQHLHDLVAVFFVFEIFLDEGKRVLQCNRSSRNYWCGRAIVALDDGIEHLICQFC